MLMRATRACDRLCYGGIAPAKCKVSATGPPIGIAGKVARSQVLKDRQRPKRAQGVSFDTGTCQRSGVEVAEQIGYSVVRVSRIGLDAGTCQRSGVEVTDQIGCTVMQVSRIGAATRREAWRGCTIGRSRAGRRPSRRARGPQIVALTLKPSGRGVTHWTTHDLARTKGVSQTTVHRLRQAHAMKPHSVQTFKFTSDTAGRQRSTMWSAGLYLYRRPTRWRRVWTRKRDQAVSRSVPIGRTESPPRDRFRCSNLDHSANGPGTIGNRATRRRPLACHHALVADGHPRDTEALRNDQPAGLALATAVVFGRELGPPSRRDVPAHDKRLMFSTQTLRCSIKLRNCRSVFAWSSASPGQTAIAVLGRRKPRPATGFRLAGDSSSG
jgi:hypothetical protein